MVDMGFFVDCEHHPFNNDATGFDFVNAWWMADHSRIAYVKSTEIAFDELKQAGYKDVHYLSDDKTGTKVYITWNDDHIVISFTGTEPSNGSKDYLTDINFIPTKSGQGGVVHTGFKTAFESVWDKVTAVLKTLGNKPIWITGHSLGGALAVLAASRIDAKACYTFGAPRVGSKEFNASIKTPIYHVAKNNDIVTRVPTPPLFRHAGMVYFITNDQSVLVNPGVVRRTKERMGGSEIKILWLLIKILILKAPLDFVLSYLHGHSPYNYSVFMWNNIDNQGDVS